MLQRYAKLKDNVVIKLHILSIDAILDEDGNVDLEIGSNLLAQLNEDQPENFIPCKRNGDQDEGDSLGVVAVQGYVYDRELDEFRPPQRFPSWVFDTNSWSWEAPVAQPEDGQKYYWDEEATEWRVAAEIPAV